MATATTSIHLEPTAAKFIESLAAQGGKPIYQMSITEARAVLEELQSQPVGRLPAVEENQRIPCGPNGHVMVTIVRPQNAPAALPAVMYFHGGGWILGSRNTHDRLIREIANGADAAVVFVNYTPSPEARYPIPIEEAFAATKYVAEHGSEMGVDGTRLAVAGDSVGGNMAAAVAILAKQRGGPRIACQALLYPVTDAGMDTESYQQFADGPWLTKPAMEWFWDAYAPDRDMRNEITASPLRASSEELAGLPAALVITDENDVLRDEGEAYAHRLMAAGVDVTAVRYLGTIHDFAMLNAVSDTPAAKSAIALTNASLQRALSTSRELAESEHYKGHI